MRASAPSASPDRRQGPPSEAKPWHAQSADAVLEWLGSRSAGLTAEQACARLASHGPNRLKEQARTSAWRRLGQQFHNPLIYILLVTCGLTALLQEWVDTAVILAVVIANAIVGYLQESKAEDAIESLKALLSPSALVKRAGQKRKVLAETLVPGDIVLLQGGDQVPADLRLIQARNLQSDEATLTGESLPSAKGPSILATECPVADRSNMAFAGSLITTGSAEGVVVETGEQTEIGCIAGMLREVEGVETPLARRLAYFSKVITVAILLFCGVVFGAGLLAGQSATQMLMVAVALAVSAIPEGLPAIMTITLAIGVKRMATRQAVIRKLPAVEALGSTTVICSDKTGTLTRNEMAVTEIVTRRVRYEVTGVGYAPAGRIEAQRPGGQDPRSDAELQVLLRACALCNEAVLRQDGTEWGVDGDPTEGALLTLAAKGGVMLEDLAGRCPRTDVIPFDAEQQYMATLNHDHAGHGMIYVKGSPERILGMCTPQPDNRWQTEVARMAAAGLRVLALAHKGVGAEHVTLRREQVQDGLTLLGIVGLMDPPREEALRAIAHCQRAGIRVKMITGDHIETARSIGSQLGVGNGDALAGAALEKLNDAQLAEAASSIDVFARVSPPQKLRLVQALQGRGEIVAMTGDGVNDAPALKQADIGVAMGITGTDVSKQASDMVLLDDNFASIESAVEEGRTVFGNLRKTIVFILPTNGGECLTLVAALLLGAVLPILPLHILWINLITTAALALTLAFEPVEPGVMRRPPRLPGAPIIDRHLIFRIVYVSVLMAGAASTLFHLELAAGHDLNVARTVAVNTIVFAEVFYLLNCRRLTESMLHRNLLRGNRTVLLGILAVFGFQALFTYHPWMQGLFDTAPMSGAMWLRVLLAGAALMLLVEVEKWIVRARPRRR